MDAIRNYGGTEEETFLTKLFGPGRLVKRHRFK